MDVKEIRLETGPAINALLSALLGSNAKTVAEEMGDKAKEHEGRDCNCSACQVSRFQVPINPDPVSDEGIEMTVAALKDMIELGNSCVKKTKEWQAEMMMQPLPVEAESAILQLCVERMNSIMRAEQTLVALLPAEQRPPEDYTHGDKPVTLAWLQDTMARARVRTQETWNVRARESAAQEALKAAAQKPTDDGNAD